MSIITDIKRRILELDGGAFQELCDALLSRKGYKGIHAYGMHTGTMKTTKGNPDTYFKSDSGKYIFVAYTTQQSQLFEKAKEDVEKCLDVSKTGITKEDIEEVIYCHTSSNLSAGDDKKLHDMCESKGILFDIYGLDRIADEIYRNHKILSKDHLGLSIDTNQIMEYQDFICKYDSNEMATPLSTVFQFREKECAEMIEKLDENKVIAVVGHAGVGKTRLSLEVAKKYGEDNGYKIFCVRSMDMPIAEDIASYLERPKKYLIFVDDANELKNMKPLLEYLNYSHLGYDVKIIASMRDYTSEKVIREIKNYTKPYICKITHFTDEEIKKFLDVNMEIRNPEYVNAIIRIAEGNPRIAYMAGKLAKEKQNLNAIKDSTELYENYYGKFMVDSEIIADNNLCLTAGIVSLLHTINLTDLRCLEKVFGKSDMNEQIFRENVYRLFELEVVDIKYEKVAIISDQCLGNYMLFLCFFKKKCIAFADILEVGFRNFRNGIIKATNILWNIFNSEDVQGYLEEEIKKVWDIFQNDSEELFCEYVKVFHHFRSEDALLYAQDKIEKVEANKIDVDIIDFDENEFRKEDEIIELLSGYRYHEMLPEAIHLLCNYVEKRQDSIKAVYECIKNNYSINQYSNRNNYYTEKTVLEVLKNRRKSDILTKLYLLVAFHFSKLIFKPTESGRGNTFIIYTIPIVLNDGSKELRKGIWKEIFLIAEDKEWQYDIWKGLNQYSTGYHEGEKDVIAYDQRYIIDIIQKISVCSEIKKCILCKQLDRKWKHYGIDQTDKFDTLYSLEIFQIYMLFTERDWGNEISFEEAQQTKKDELKRYANSIGLEAIENFVKQLNVIVQECENKEYEIVKSTEDFIEEMQDDNEKLIAFVEALIKYGRNIDIYPQTILEKLFDIWGVEKTYWFIIKKEFYNKNKWLFSFFKCLPSNILNEKWEERFFEYLKEDSDKDIKSSSYRNLSFLKNYLSIDSKIFIKTTKIILEKEVYSPFIVKIYLELFFNKHCFMPDEVMGYFENEVVLLKQVYFTLVRMNAHIDYDGTFFKYFVFKDNSWMDEYAKLFNAEIETYADHEHDRLCSCWNLENYLELFDCLFESMEEDVGWSQWRIIEAFRNLLIPQQGRKGVDERQKEWVLHAVRKNYNNNKIYVLFKVISELSEELRKEAIQIFVSLNKDFDIFKKLELEPNSWGGSGSMIPCMQGRARYYESLLPIFTGLTLLKHKKYIQYNIEIWKNRIKNEEIKEAMEFLYY